MWHQDQSWNRNYVLQELSLIHILFIAMAPSLGFLGTVIGMVHAFDKIQQVGDISPTVVAVVIKATFIPREN